MNNLPMNRKNNLFIKIKMFFKSLFNSKEKIKPNVSQQQNIDPNAEKNKFQDEIKVTGIKYDELSKIEMQNQKNDLLEMFAKNPQLLNNLSMDELIKIEDMYDEEIKKITANS